MWFCYLQYCIHLSYLLIKQVDCQLIAVIETLNFLLKYLFPKRIFIIFFVQNRIFFVVFFHIKLYINKIPITGRTCIPGQRVAQELYLVLIPFLVFQRNFRLVWLGFAWLGFSRVFGFIGCRNC